MSLWIVCCLAPVVAVGALLVVYGWRWMTRPRTNAPGPTPLPLVGNLLYFRNLPVVAEHFRKLHRLYGDVFRFYVGAKLFLVVTQPEDAKRLLVDTKMRERDSYVMRHLTAYVGNGLVTNKDHVWQTHRKLIEPTFHRKMLRDLTDEFNDSARLVCEKLTASGGVELDVSPLLLLCTLRTLVASVVGVRLDDLEPDLDKQVEIIDELTESMVITQKRVFLPWMQIGWLFSMTSDGQAFKRQLSLLNGFARKAVAFKRARKCDVPPSKKKMFGEQTMGFVPELPLSEEEIHDEVRTLTIAGTDTTANAMGATLALLGLYPEWQDAVRKELHDVFGTSANYLRPSTDEDLAQLKVMDSVIKETLRLYPPGPNASVYVTEDIAVGGNRFTAPRGSCVLVALNLLHRRPELFPEPDKFDPGRFLEGGSACSLPPFSYLPFGAGSRKCVGYRLAMMLIKTVLAGLLRQFQVLPGSTRQQLDEFEISVTGKPVTGFRITCVPYVNRLSSSA